MSDIITIATCLVKIVALILAYWHGKLFFAGNRDNAKTLWYGIAAGLFLMGAAI